MPVAGPAMGAAVVAMLTATGIPFHAKRQVQYVDVAARELVFADDQRESFDFLLAASILV